MQPGKFKTLARLQVYNYNNDKCGIVHITIGDGGNQEGLSGLNYLSSSNGQDPLANCALLASHCG